MKFPAFAVLGAAVLLSGCSFLNSIGAPDRAPAPIPATAPATFAPLAAGARDPWCENVANQERNKMIANSASPQTQNNIFEATYRTCVANAAPPRR
jgi:hypothetical protein